MGEMVERVARAICSADFEDPDADYGGHPRWKAFVANAQAAILAMREPTEAMRKAADLEAAMAHFEHGGIGYRAMIDAALNAS